VGKIERTLGILLTPKKTCKTREKEREGEKRIAERAERERSSEYQKMPSYYPLISLFLIA
jgi:hypothetical protein